MFYLSFFERISLVIKIMNIGSKLKELREEKNITQEELALILNINRVQYNQYENDYFNIPIKYIINIADYYNVSIDYLLNMSTNKNAECTYNIVDYKLAGERLKKIRKEHKLTQQKLASILNTTHSNIGFYEKGRNLIATPFLYQICHKYHVSADYLLGRIDENSQK